MSLAYLDVDDEITSAANRIRTADDSRIALVLPAGSRLGTSRINFRLLAREAQSRSKSLAIVSPDGSTRALAASAGLPVFASVFEYEAALAERASVGEGVSEAAAATAPGTSTGPMVAQASTADSRPVTSREGAPTAEPAAPTPTLGPGAVPVAGPRSAAAGLTGAVARPAASTSRSSRGARAAVLAIAGIVVLGAAVLALLLLPAATIDLVVRPVPLGPIPLTVTADPAASTPDPSSGVVPAERAAFPLSATGTFKATGKKVTDTKATGSVRWQNCDPTSAYRLPAGTLVRTSSGFAFATAESLLLPVAVLSGNPPTITCQYRDVDVTATKAGPDGNVPAGAIDVIPGAYNSVVLRVTNPAATSGGSHSETPMVSQADVDAAVKALTTQLDGQLATAAADPASVPAGRSPIAGTGTRNDPTPSVDPATLVGQEVPTFDLTLTAQGTVTAVDPSAVRALAEQELRDHVPAGSTLVEGTAAFDIGEPSAQGQAAAYAVTARAETIRQVDVGAIRRLVEGRSAADAQSALAEYGEATVALSPFWVTTVPANDMRVEVRVHAQGAPGAGESPPSSGSATP